jgi:hypothetical protein
MADRPAPALREAAEAESLLSQLTRRRHEILDQLRGLTDAELRRSVGPSGWTRAGLVRHLTLDDERFWFSAVVAGESAAIECALQDGDNWLAPRQVRPGELVRCYRHQIEVSDAVIRSTPLDQPPAWLPLADAARLPEVNTLRDVLVHMILVTAGHGGQLSAARDILDHRRALVRAP